MSCLAQPCGNGSKQVTLGSDCVWVQERREGVGVFGSWVGGEDLDGGEQERQIAYGKQDFLLEPGQQVAAWHRGGEMVRNQNNQRD